MVEHDTLRELYRVMRLSREFENKTARLWHEAEMHGEAHLSNGHEAVAAGIGAHLTDDDSLAATHRNHCHAIAKGVDLEPLFAELLGRESGLCGGKGGHMHLFDAPVNFGTSGIIAGGLPLSLGSALAASYRENGSVSVALLGDGAANQGAVHECLNLASVWDLPMVFVITDDAWAVSMRKTETTAVDSNTLRAIGHDMPGLAVDGMDVEEIYHAAGYAVERARKGDGPTLIEAACYKFRGHFEALPQEVVADEEEIEYWKGRDPVPNTRKKLLDRGEDESTLEAMEADIEDTVEAAASFALESELPDPDTALISVFSDGGEYA